MSDSVNKNIFEDFLRIATGSSAGVLGGARDAMGAAQQEFQTFMRTNFDRMANEMKLARSDDLETVKAMIAESREAQERLTQQFAEISSRIAEIEKTLAATRSEVKPENKKAK